MKKLQDLMIVFLFSEVSITCLMAILTNKVTIKSNHFLEIIVVNFWWNTEGYHWLQNFTKKPPSHNKRQFTASLVLNISEAKENTFDSSITYTFLRNESGKANGILEEQWSANTALELFQVVNGKKNAQLGIAVITNSVKVHFPK